MRQLNVGICLRRVCPRALNPLPRVCDEAGDLVGARIDQVGGDVFTREAVGAPEPPIPNFCGWRVRLPIDRPDDARTMQEFALLHQALLIQSLSDLSISH